MFVPSKEDILTFNEYCHIVIFFNIICISGILISADNLFIIHLSKRAVKVLQQRVLRVLFAQYGAVCRYAPVYAQ